MNKSVLISIRPNWCDKIASGRKTMEIRKTRPKLETPFKCFIYMTKQKKSDDGWLAAVETEHGCYYGAGSVIGEFVCDKIEDFSDWKYEYAAMLRHIDLFAATNGDYAFLSEYIPGKKGYGWNISDLKIYDTPKQLADFGLSRPPQSWQYINR